MIEGIVTALITPFRGDDLDEIALVEHASRVLDGGSAGVLVTGSSGEYLALTKGERTRAWKSVVSVANGAHVMAGIGEPSTLPAVEMAEAARTAGVDSILVTPPFFGRPTPGGLVEHFKAVARASGLPIVIYNNPGRAGFNIDADSLEMLLEVEEIAGIKDCDRDLANISEKIRRFGTRISVLSGDDDLGWPTLLCGARGGIWATGNLIPSLPVALYDAAMRGQVERGRLLHDVIAELCKAWYVAGHPAAAKSGVDQRYGLDTGLRRPLTALEPAQAAHVARAIGRAEEAVKELGERP